VLLRERPEVQEVPRSLTADLLRLGLAALIVATAVAGYATLRIWQQGEVDESARTVDAIVVLGAAQYDGVPSAVFAARIDHAVDLYAAGHAPWLVVTGGRAEGDRFSEAATARQRATSAGVPDAAILAESTGRDTRESLRNVASLMQAHGLHSALFVSDRTHMLRVLRIASDLGIDAYGSPTPAGPTRSDPPALAMAVLHELGALLEYLVAGS
jgi:uncharacterized SAM-binding protein YcdF (DUF218 family)